MTGFRLGTGEAAGAAADLGVLVPLSTALILVNGLDPGSVLMAAGALVLASGLVFRIPFPVQPLKALTAVAVAQGVAPEVIHAAGLEIGAVLVLLSVGRVADVIAGVFTKPVIRALQFGVGVLLVVTAWRLAAETSPVFRQSLHSPWPVLLAATALVIVVAAVRARRFGVALAVLAVGVLGAVVGARPELAAPSITWPRFGLPSTAAFASAFFVLVIPQIPLTFGNAVVSVSDLAHEYFGSSARRVSPSRVCLSCGLGNVAAALVGGMPMCHGAGGLTAHVRLGARTAAMNVLLGSVLVGLGLFFAPQVTVILGLLPAWGLAAFLVYAGARHALLVGDLRGSSLLPAVGAGLVGAVLGNLAITAATMLVFDHGRRIAARSRSRRPAAAQG
jgi:MFS superfamily sulfate permease-like transporter